MAQIATMVLRGETLHSERCRQLVVDGGKVVLVVRILVDQVAVLTSAQVVAQVRRLPRARLRESM
jgi:hypothetical protein